jgi:hypothetical protein
MAGFHTKTFTKHNDYMTPKSAWENIVNYIPKNKIIWESFYGDGTSGQYLTELGFKNVIHQDKDFFKWTPEKYDLIVSNPPFQFKKEVLTRLKQLEKPFIMIMPCSSLTTQYFRKLFSESEDRIQIIIPRKRIHFVKLINGKKPENWKNACNFDCFYFCYKINLPNDMLWLK